MCARTVIMVRAGGRERGLWRFTGALRGRRGAEQHQRAAVQRAAGAARFAAALAAQRGQPQPHAGTARRQSTTHPACSFIHISIAEKSKSIVRIQESVMIWNLITDFIFVILDYKMIVRWSAPNTRVKH